MFQRAITLFALDKYDSLWIQEYVIYDLNNRYKYVILFVNFKHIFVRVQNLKGMLESTVSYATNVNYGKLNFKDISRRICHKRIFHFISDWFIDILSFNDFNTILLTNAWKCVEHSRSIYLYICYTKSVKIVCTRLTFIFRITNIKLIYRLISNL